MNASRAIGAAAMIARAKHGLNHALNIRVQNNVPKDAVTRAMTAPNVHLVKTAVHAAIAREAVMTAATKNVVRAKIKPAAKANRAVKIHPAVVLVTA